MAKLAQTRKRFQALAWVLGIIAAIAGMALVLPLRPPAYEKDAELNDAKLTAKRLESEVGPLRDLPEKLIKARSDIGAFYKERFPDRFSAVPESLGKLAVEHKVRLTDVKYETSDNGMPAGLHLVAMEADLGGEYPNVVHFINALERSKTFFLIDRITLGEEGSGGGVRLQIRIVSILRSSPTTPTTAKGSRT